MSDIHDLAGPYVLGSLPAEERSAFEKHLDDCVRCQAEVASLAEGLVALADADAETPPRRLRDQVLSSVQAESGTVADIRRRRPVWAYLVPAAAAVAIVVALVVVGDGSVGQVLDAPDAEAIELVPTDAYTGPDPEVARVVFSVTEQAAVAEFAGLSAPGDGDTYQLWLIDASGPVSAGTFEPNRTGEATVRLEGQAQRGKTVGLTEEPSGGSSSPTGEVLFVAEL